MEEIFNSIVNIDDEYILPVSYKWKKVYEFAARAIKDNGKDYLVKRLNSFISILSSTGDVYEDVVLKTAIYYFLSINTKFKIDSINESKSVNEGVKILILGEEEDNLKHIFENNNYRYLNKIKLAYLICLLTEVKKSNNIVNVMKLSSEAKSIITKFEKYCHFGLCNKLKAEL